MAEEVRREGEGKESYFVIVKSVKFVLVARRQQVGKLYMVKHNRKLWDLLIFIDQHEYFLIVIC